jgi:hypothetical protein
MTADLETALADYRTGLDAELEVLGQIEDVATRQRALPGPAAAEALTALALERQRQLARLTALEQQVHPLRQQIASQLGAVRQLPGYAGVAERHRTAAATVARITRLDDENLSALTSADAERRGAAHDLDTGEATLSAYRRSLQQPHVSAGLFTQRG